MDWFYRKVLKTRNAYRALFRPGESALSPAAEIVLLDLAKFCRATSTPAVVSPITQQIDPIATGITIGRLEVWHRVTQNVHLSDADLYSMLNREREQGEHEHE